MNKNRLEAFSDGVIAILITIMVLELKVPRGDDLAALREVTPIFLTYVLSFVFLAIYWNNHHHMLHATSRINGAVLWANMHLLFWLSLVPFVTGWMGQNHLARTPTSLYGAVMLLAGIAYMILYRTIVSFEGPGSKLKEAVGKDVKAIRSLVLYAIAIPAALLEPRVAVAIYICVAMSWLVPDRRIESALNQ